jgi:putative transposase
VTPDTILRWHQKLIARKWTFEPKRAGRPGIMHGILSLIVRMATENPTWGYTRIQGALKNLGHGVARSTSTARPEPERSFRTLRAQTCQGASAD